MCVWCDCLSVRFLQLFFFSLFLLLFVSILFIFVFNFCFYFYFLCIYILILMLSSLSLSLSDESQGNCVCAAVAILYIWFSNVCALAPLVELRMDAWLASTWLWIIPSVSFYVLDDFKVLSSFFFSLSLSLFLSRSHSQIALSFQPVFEVHCKCMRSAQLRSAQLGTVRHSQLVLAKLVPKRTTCLSMWPFVQNENLHIVKYANVREELNTQKKQKQNKNCTLFAIQWMHQHVK